MLEDAELVLAARGDRPELFGELVARWFDRCWEVAWRILRDRELAADVAQETLSRAWEELDRLEQPGSFGGWVLRIARNRALDRQRRERWTVSTADESDLEPAAIELPVDHDPARQVEAQQAAELVWSAARVLGARDLSILDLHLRHGLEPHELADELGIAPNAAHQALFRLRSRLGGAVRARLLWRDGEPACVNLRAELAAVGAETFDAATVRSIEQHVPDCLTCSEEQARVTDPVALFAAIPFVAAPLALRAEAVRWLAGAGVPIEPAYAATGEAAESSGDRDGDGGGPGGAAAGPGGGWARRVGAVLVVVAALVGVGTLAAVEVRDGLVPAPDTEAAADSEDDARSSRPPVASTPTGSDPAEDDETAPLPDDPDREPPSTTPDPTSRPTTEAPSADPTTPPAGRREPAPDPSPERTRPPASAPEPTDEPTDDPPAPAPRIDRFVVRAGAPCPRSGGNAHTIAWETAEATLVRLAEDGGLAEDVEPSGRTVRCAPLGTSFTLTADGPGGTTERTATAN